MNPGKLNEKIEVLMLVNADNMYYWKVKTRIWAKVERLNGTNIFSKVGIGAKSLKFTIRKFDLTLHNALRWQGKHCYLTDIVEIDRMYYEVTAALIEPKICIAERTGEPTLDELNRPVYGDPAIITFPGCVTEKYIRDIQNEPMSSLEIRYVLVTPKIIELQEGELVTIDNTPYEILIPHTLDEYKNEYEILARRNA